MMRRNDDFKNTSVAQHAGVTKARMHLRRKHGVEAIGGVEAWLLEDVLRGKPVVETG
jgi:hypothetical protein